MACDTKHIKIFFSNTTNTTTNITHRLNVSVFHSLVVEDSVGPMTLLTADRHMHLHASVMYLMGLCSHTSSLLLVMYHLLLMYHCRLMKQKYIGQVRAMFNPILDAENYSFM